MGFLLLLPAERILAYSAPAGPRDLALPSPSLWHTVLPVLSKQRSYRSSAQGARWSGSDPGPPTHCRWKCRQPLPPRAPASSFMAWGCRCYCAPCLIARAAVGIKMRGVLKAVSPVLVPAVVMTMTFVSKGSGPPTSGPLHLLFPLPGMSSMLIPALSDVSSPSIHLMLPKIPVFSSSISTTLCNSMSLE